jgi:hypothetical protein
MHHSQAQHDAASAPTHCVQTAPMLQIANAETTNDAESTANATPSPNQTIMNPARAGPTNKEAVSVNSTANH